MGLSTDCQYCFETENPSRCRITRSNNKIAMALGINPGCTLESTLSSNGESHQFRRGDSRTVW